MLLLLQVLLELL